MKKIELVQRECQRLQDLLDNFLQFAKAHRLNLQPSDLNAQVRQVLDFYRPKAQEAGVEVVDYLAGNLPTVLLDREAFHGALLNLVLNAEQAMPNGGQLVVRTYGTADGVALGPDRHGLRHGRGHAGEGVRRLLFHQARRLGPGAAHHAEDHRGPRRPDHPAERARPRHASDHQAPVPPACRPTAAETGFAEKTIVNPENWQFLWVCFTGERQQQTSSDMSIVPSNKRRFTEGDPSICPAVKLLARLMIGNKHCPFHAVVGKKMTTASKQTDLSLCYASQRGLRFSAIGRSCGI